MLVSEIPPAYVYIAFFFLMVGLVVGWMIGACRNGDTEKEGT